MTISIIFNVRRTGYHDMHWLLYSKTLLVLVRYRTASRSVGCRFVQPCEGLAVVQHDSYHGKVVCGVRGVPVARMITSKRRSSGGNEQGPHVFREKSQGKIRSSRGVGTPVPLTRRPQPTTVIPQNGCCEWGSGLRIEYRRKAMVRAA